MNYTVLTYMLYLVISIPLTIWVARTLKINGHYFLVETFNGDTKLAESVNHLLVVGFYLINIGFVTLFLKLSIEIAEIRTIFEALSTKVGVVLLVLGGMHFFNLYVFARMRRRATVGTMPPPVRPTTNVAK